MTQKHKYQLSTAISTYTFKDYVETLHHVSSQSNSPSIPPTSTSLHAPYTNANKLTKQGMFILLSKQKLYLKEDAIEFKCEYVESYKLH